LICRGTFGPALNPHRIGNAVLKATVGAMGDASAPQVPAAARRLLFISHANPQDNAAASWFATQLELLGYEVWCDLKNTSAGESDFWLKVQKKIDNDAAKFKFILSNNSRDFEKKSGIYKEVQAADNLKRDNFILPLRIEKLTGTIPILISPDLYIDGENWAAGLRELQKRLVKDGVLRHQTPDYQKIISWWPAVSAQEM
jgi:TIR domain